MAALRPTFRLALGALRSSTDAPALGPTALLVERDMDVAADGLAVWLMERPDVEPGDPVSLDLGHDGDDTPVFTGEVASTSVALDGARVTAVGTLNRLLVHRHAGAWERQSAGTIVSDLAAGAGIETGTVSDGPTLPVFAVDRRVPAWVHARGLADRLGYELYADRRGRLMFQALGAAASLDAAAGGLGGLAAAAASALGPAGGAEGYQYGRHLLALRASAGRAPVGQMTIGGESPMSAEGESTAHWLTANERDFAGSAGSGAPSRAAWDPAARTRDLADRFAAGRLVTANRRAREIAVTVVGRPSVDLGDPISVAGVADGLGNGGGYVRAIRHRFGGGWGFTTEFRIAPEAGS
jgi:hypothetical protein